MKRLYVVRNCAKCPNCDTRISEGGNATDYLCKEMNPPKLIAGWVPSASKAPEDGKFPAWCPLTESTEVLNMHAREKDHLILKTDVLYRFTVSPSCPDCRKAADGD